MKSANLYQQLFLDLDSPKLGRLMAFFLLVAVLLVYGNSLRNGFVWDDTYIIVQNPINRSLSNLGAVVTGPDVVFQDQQTYYYRPLNRLTYMLEYALYGLKPFGYHLINLLLHAANTLLLLSLGRKLFRLPIAAFLTALLFAVHPVNTEAVNFISGRNNALATLFVLLTTLFFYRGERTGIRRNYVLAALTLFAGLLTKEIALMVLPFLLVAPSLEGDESWSVRLRRRALALLPGVAAAVMYLLIRLMVLPAAVGSAARFSLWERLGQNLYAVPKYLALILYPAELKIYHSVPEHYADNWLLLALAWLLIVGIGYLLIRSGGPSAWFGLAWLVVNYVPISQIVPFASAPIAERYLYLPAIGFWIVAGSMVQMVAARSRLRSPLVAALVVLICVLGGTTWQRNQDWYDNVTLFSALVQSDGNSATGHYSLGGAYLLQDNLELARKHWLRTVEIDPQHVAALTQLGSASLAQGALLDAEQYYRRALESDPMYSEAHYNLATILEQTGRYPEAIKHYQTFLQILHPEHRYLVPEVQRRLSRMRLLFADPPSQ